jgi:hypothetical protein
MKGNIFDLYSSLGFFNALESKSAGGCVPGTAGTDIDLQGYDGCVFVVNVGAINFAAASALHMCLQHAKVSTAGGAGTYSMVPGSLLIHSVYGGYDSTAETGIFHSMTVGSTSTVYAVGYKGLDDYRYVRVYISGDGGTGSMQAGAIALLGAHNWPVNTPVN